MHKRTFAGPVRHLQHAVSDLTGLMRRTFRRIRVGGGLALALLLVLGVADYQRFMAGSGRALDAYPLLSLDGYRHLLVFAPHCDDEVLGAGGLIYAALKRGLDVQVVIATNGDGHPLAAMDEGGRLVPGHEDFMAMGVRRQQESLDALSRLGLDPDAVLFLGYPDVGLSALWWKHWSSDWPYRSLLSGLDRSSYARAFRPGTPYAGESLLGDLRTILAAGPDPGAPSQ